ncbi:hypothetical protein ZWY2020_041233 [Hordeum vulgare]|nr:hypothetical protein ZWY2020_041233 [Hordeum vulgare]
MAGRHTIILMQPSQNRSSRTLMDYNSINHALMENQDINPMILNITYDITDLYNFIDGLADISALVLTDRKKIHLTRYMVKKIFNLPSGNKPLEFNKRGKTDFREVYLDGERAPIPTTIVVLSNASDDDEEIIDFALPFIGPSSWDMKYGASRLFIHLRRHECVHEFEWDEHILFDVMREVNKYQDKRNDGKLKFLIGGCLPMLPQISFIP